MPDKPVGKTWRLNSTFAAHLRQTIRIRRRKKPLNLLAQVAEKYLRAWHNEGFFEFQHNGEAFAMRCFARWAGNRDLVVWDIGANYGDWAQEALQIFPQASIHSFEILPPIANAYHDHMGQHKNLKLHRVGLSDTQGEVDVTWNTKFHSTSAINYRDTDDFGDDLKTLRCKVSTADTLLAAGLPPPNLMKIDTEGHDPAVLRGAKNLLAGDNAPDMIQFEYGETWLPSGETLARVQVMLEHHGYKVGRLFPTHVGFKSYDYSDDHFRMGNMIAARHPELVRLLSG